MPAFNWPPHMEIKQRLGTAEWWICGDGALGTPKKHGPYVGKGAKADAESDMRGLRRHFEANREWYELNE